MQESQQVLQLQQPREKVGRSYIKATILRPDELYNDSSVGRIRTIQENIIGQNNLTIKTQTFIMPSAHMEKRSGKFETHIQAASVRKLELQTYTDTLKTRFLALGYTIEDDIKENTQSIILKRSGHMYRLVIGTETNIDLNLVTHVMLTALDHDNYPDIYSQRDISFEEGDKFENHIYEYSQTVIALLEGIFSVAHIQIPQAELIFSPRSDPEKSILEHPNKRVREGILTTVSETKVARAKQGVEEIKDLLNGLANDHELQAKVRATFFDSLSTIKSGQLHEVSPHANEDIPALFLGLKPLAILTSEELALLQQISTRGLLPERIKVVETPNGLAPGVLYDTVQVREVVLDPANKNFFYNFSGYEGNIDIYIRNTVDAETFVPYDDEDEITDKQIQTELLLGSPLGELTLLAHFINTGKDFFQVIRSEIKTILINRKTLRENNPDFLLMLEYITQNSEMKLETKEDAEKLLTIYGKDFAQYLRGICIQENQRTGSPIPTLDWLYYAIKSKDLKGYGTKFTGFSLNALHFLAEREEIFYQSGIVDIIGGNIPHTARNNFLAAMTMTVEGIESIPKKIENENDKEIPRLVNDIVQTALEKTQNPLSYDPSTIFPWAQYRELHGGSLPDDLVIFQEQDKIVEGMMICALYGGDPLKEVLPFANVQSSDANQQNELARIYQAYADVIFSGKPLEVRLRDVRKNIIFFLKNSADNSLVAIRQNFTEAGEVGETGKEVQKVDKGMLGSVKVIHGRALHDGRYQITYILVSSEKKAVITKKITSDTFSADRTPATAAEGLISEVSLLLKTAGNEVITNLVTGDILEKASVKDLQETLLALQSGVPDTNSTFSAIGDTLLLPTCF